MYNVDVIIFAGQFTKDLADDGLFDASVDPFLDKEIFHEELLKISETNMCDNGNPIITDEQFDMIISTTRSKCVNETMYGLIERGFVTLSAMDKNGDFCLDISHDLKIIKKNI